MNGIQEIKKELDIRTNQVSRIVKEIGEKLVLPGVSVDKKVTFYSNTFRDGSFIRANYHYLTFDERFIVGGNTSYSGMPDWEDTIPEYLNWARKEKTKHAYYQIVHGLMQAIQELLPEVLNQAKKVISDMEYFKKQLINIIQTA